MAFSLTVIFVMKALYNHF